MRIIPFMYKSYSPLTSAKNCFFLCIRAYVQEEDQIHMNCGCHSMGESNQGYLVTVSKFI